MSAAGTSPSMGAGDAAGDAAGEVAGGAGDAAGEVVGGAGDAAGEWLGEGLGDVEGAVEAPPQAARTMPRKAAARRPRFQSVTPP